MKYAVKGLILVEDIFEADDKVAAEMLFSAKYPSVRSVGLGARILSTHAIVYTNIPEEKEKHDTNPV